jgi:peptide/nickel transport system permease protein
MNSEILKILLKRFSTSLVTLFLLVSFLFIIIRLSPGDPTDKYVSDKLGTELSQKIAERFSLNQSVTTQYFSFISNILKGDFGVSYNYRLPVFEVIWEYFSFTLVFASISFVIQIFLSIVLALSVIKKRNEKFEESVSNFALFIYSIPSFVLGVALIYVFSVHLNILPISGIKSLDYENLSFFGKLSDRLLHIILPLITLSSGGVALFYKYIKESMNEVVHQSFVINLRASGVSEKEILKKHVLPNAIRPLISVAGVELGVLMGGALITEVIFGLPGMGRLAIESVLTRDYPLVVACVFTAGTAIILANFLADIIKLKVDKRLIRGILN